MLDTSSNMTTHHPRQHPIILITGMSANIFYLSSTLPFLPSFWPRQRSSRADQLSGTPGTGKTLHSHLLELETSGSSSPLKHLNIGDIVKEHGFHEGWDEEWQSYTVDEDRLLDYLEEVVNPEAGPSNTGELTVLSSLSESLMACSKGAVNVERAKLDVGFIIDHHDPSLFPERWIDLAVVLVCDNGVLHERLTAR